MVDVTELVSQMHETLSDIRSTISSITSPQHEALLDNVEKHRDTTVASLQSEYTAETTDLAQKRAAEMSAVAEQRRREDEERAARRRQEDEALAARAEAEDKARQLALAEKTAELEEQAEAEMARIEAEADRMLDDGQARLVTLEQRRRDLNQQIDEQMRLPLPVAPWRRKTRQQTQQTAPVVIMPWPAPTEPQQTNETPAETTISPQEPTLSHDSENHLQEEPTPITHSELPSSAFQSLASESMAPAVVEADIEPVRIDGVVHEDQADKESSSIINESGHDGEGIAAAETVPEEIPEEKPAQEHSTAAADDVVVSADEEVAHEHPEETSLPEIQIAASEFTHSSIPSIEFMPPTPAPEKTELELPAATPAEEGAVAARDVAEPEASAPLVHAGHDEGHRPEEEATRELDVRDIASAVSPLPEQFVAETHAAKAPAASSATLSTQIETHIEILSIPALPLFEPKVVAGLENTIPAADDEEPVLMYLPSTCYSPEPPVFVFPSPPPVSVSNVQVDVASEHVAEAPEETRREHEAHELAQHADLHAISSVTNNVQHNPEEAVPAIETAKIDAEPIASAPDVEQHDDAKESSQSIENAATTELADAAAPVRQFFEQQTTQDSSSAWHYQAPYVAPDVYAYAAPQFVDASSYFASPQSLEPSPVLYEAASKDKEPAENAVTVHGQDDLFDVSNESDGSVSPDFVDSPREDQFEYDNISIDASGNVIVQHRSPVLADAHVPETPTTVVGDAPSPESHAEEQAIHGARPATPESAPFSGLPVDDPPAPVTPPQLYAGDDDDPGMDGDFMPRDVTHISWDGHNIYTTPGSVRSEATVSEASLSATPYSSGHDLHHNEPFIRSSWVDTPPESVLDSRNKALRQLDYALSLDTTTPTNTPPTTAMPQQQQQPKSRPSSIAAVSPSILFQRMRSIFEPANAASAVSDGNTWTTTTPIDTPPQNRYSAVVPFAVSPGLSPRDLDPAASSTGHRLADSGFVKGIANAPAAVDDPERRHDDYHHHHRQDEDEYDGFSEQTSLLRAAAPISPSY